MKLRLHQWLLAALACAAATAVLAQSPDRLQATDLYRMKSVGDVQFSPDRTRIAYTVSNNNGPGRPYSQLWIMELGSDKSTRVGDDKSRGSQPTWSPDGSRLAFNDNRQGLPEWAADGQHDICDSATPRQCADYIAYLLMVRSPSS